jgi:hypothetical protein
MLLRSERPQLPTGSVSHGQDPEGRNRTIILWREVDLVDGTVGALGGTYARRHDDHRDRAHSCPGHRGGAGDFGGCPVSAPVTEQGSSTVTDLTDEVGLGIAACTGPWRDRHMQLQPFLVSVRDVE